MVVFCTNFPRKLYDLPGVLPVLLSDHRTLSYGWLIVNISLYVWSLLNYFIELFRGSPFVPLDVLSFGTGLSVSDGYTYELSWKLILGSIMFFLIYLVNKKKCQHQTEKIKIQTAGKTCSGSLYRSCCNFPLFYGLCCKSRIQTGFLGSVQRLSPHRFLL